MLLDNSFSTPCTSTRSCRQSLIVCVLASVCDVLSAQVSVVCGYVSVLASHLSPPFSERAAGQRAEAAVR